MSENEQNRRAAASPTPEAHGNREARAGGNPDLKPNEQANEQRYEQASSTGEQRDQEHQQDSERRDAYNATEQAETLDELTRVKAQIEAILLAASEPLERATLQKCVPEEEHAHINGALEQLKLEWSGPGRGVHLQEVAGGFQLRTNPAYRDSVRRMFESTPRKLSRAAMETLAIIAYRQPLTRAEVDELRGVDSAGVIRTLEDHELIHSVGRLDDLGRPHIWGTTPRFLEFFGLSTLDALPTLSESEIDTLNEMYADALEEDSAEDL